MARQKEALETTALLKQIDMAKIGSDISSSEDELLTGDNYSPIDRKSVKNDKDDDRMSLSPLSDTEQKIEESKLVMPISGAYPYQQYPGYPGMPYSYPYSQHDWRQSYPYTHQMYLTAASSYTPYPSMHPIQNYMSYQITPKRSDSFKDDPHSPTINAVIQQITQELKAILKKDFNKKMVENTAFKKFEAWWEEESSKENKNKEEVVEKPIQSRDNINVLLEANRENLYSNINLDNVGFGLGLKASLPKMPSFRRKKIPSPIREDEDSRKLSDNDEIVHDSDTEVPSRPLRRIRKHSTSTSSSESSSLSSESESSSSDESSSDSESEVEAKVEIVKKEKTPELMEVEEVEVKKPESTKPNRYSKIYKSDSDLSDGEMEFLERRRRNTEWMEQIEKERQQREEETKPGVHIVDKKVVTKWVKVGFNDKFSSLRRPRSTTWR